MSPEMLALRKHHQRASETVRRIKPLSGERPKVQGGRGRNYVVWTGGAGIDVHSSGPVVRAEGRSRALRKTNDKD